MPRLQQDATMQDLLDRIIADPDLADGRRRNVATSIRKFVALLDLDLTMPANFRVFRDHLSRFHVGKAGMTKQRWQNIRADVSFALKRYDARSRTSYGGAVSPEWQILKDSLSDPRLERGLSRIIRWCSWSGIMPEAVDDSVMDRFHEHISDETFEKKPQHIHRDTCTLWNRAVLEVPGWPQRPVTLPSYRNLVSLKLERFPASFAADLERYRTRMAGLDLTMEDLTEKALRPKTIDHNCSKLRRFASAMVREGRPIVEITSIGALFDTPRFENAIQGEFKRLGSKPKPSLQELINTLVAIGTHYVGLPKERIVRLKKIKKNLRCRPRGFTDGNRERLRQFADERAQYRFLSLGEELLRQAPRQRTPKKKALLVQTALVHEILLIAPMRFGNLISLNINEHIHFATPGRQGAVTIIIPGDQVKNGQALDHPLPMPVGNLLRRYLSDHRPVLLVGPENGWLFPGAKPGQAKNQVTLGGQLVKAVAKHAGLTVNPHLYRHIAAYFYLLDNPADLETVRRFLGHTSLETTSMFYADFDRTMSIQRFGQLILDRKARLGNG